MKKLLFSTILLFLVIAAQAQVKFGLKAAPTLSFNRVDDDSPDYSYAPDGVGFRFQVGPTVDFEFKENHYFSTGLLFATKRVGVEIEQQGTAFYDEDYALHYLQIPLTIKLFTEEVGLDKKLYFQVGGSLDIKTKGEGLDRDFIQKFNFMDATALLAAGVEYGYGINTKLFAGIVYQRGLFNVVNESADDGLTIQNDLLGLEFGITF